MYVSTQILLPLLPIHHEFLVINWSAKRQFGKKPEGETKKTAPKGRSHSV